MFVKSLKWLFLPLGFYLPSLNEIENVMSEPTNETGFIFVSSGLYLHEQANETAV